MNNMSEEDGDVQEERPWLRVFRLFGEETVDGTWRFGFLYRRDCGVFHEQYKYATAKQLFSLKLRGEQ